MAVIIKKCGCSATPDHGVQYQDRKYGEGMRVMNLDIKKTSAKCTICGKEQKL